MQDTVHKRKQLTKRQCEEWLSLVAKNQSKIEMMEATIETLKTKIKDLNNLMI